MSSVHRNTRLYALHAPIIMPDDKNLLEKTNKMTKNNKALLLTAAGAVALVAGYQYYKYQYR